MSECRSEKSPYTLKERLIITQNLKAVINDLYGQARKE